MRGLIFLGIILCITSAFSYTVEIPLKDERIPARDLYHEGRVLSPEEAYYLKKNKNLDLSKLNPDERNNAIWRNTSPADIQLKDEIVLDNLEQTNVYSGDLTSYRGLYRFYISNDSGAYNVLMHKSLHSIFLRKNLLQKLGYQLPKMQYVKKLKISFATEEEKNNFLEYQHNFTFGAPERWVTKESSTTITLQDVAIMKSSMNDHYNVSLGVPINQQNEMAPLEDRLLRALAIPYALTYLKESINKFEWSIGKIDNEQIQLDHFAYGNLFTSLDDAKWMLRKISKLREGDIREVIRKSYFPKELEELLAQKIMSRINSLNKLFKTNFKQFPVVEKVKDSKVIKNNRITKLEWKNYATKFASGDPESPFADMEYFVFNKIQKAGITHLLGKLNEKLSLFDLTQAKIDFHRKQFEKGLQIFIDTGRMAHFGVAYWVKPILDGNLILSRDIVLGNSYGSDHLVSMADTLGYSVVAGAHVGLENIPNVADAYIRAGASFVRTFTHLRPVTDLKATAKEPYRNMMVPLIKKDLKEALSKQISNEEEEREVLGKIIEKVTDSLSVGESLIMTDRIVPKIDAGISVNLGDKAFSLNTSFDKNFIRRIHLYRKDVNTINVYKDNGHATNLSYTFSAKYKIPIIKVSGTRSKGKYTTNIYTVDINQESEKLRSNLNGLFHLLEENSTELLDISSPPYVVEGEFRDRLFRMRLLMIVDKYQRSSNFITMKAPNNKDYTFFESKYAHQTGMNMQAFTSDIVDFYVRQIFPELKTKIIDDEEMKNPGQTVRGKSTTISATYESRMVKNRLKHKFIRLSEVLEGWSTKKTVNPTRKNCNAKRKNVTLFANCKNKLERKLHHFNKWYKRELFPLDKIKGLDGLRLYNIAVHMNIYEEGVKKLFNLKKEALEKTKGNCHSSKDKACGSIKKIAACESIKRRNPRSSLLYECRLELLAKMYKDISFDEMSEILGPENIFVHGVINGFRLNSEILNDPIRANTIGNVQGGEYWNGVISETVGKLGVQKGEFHGHWLRQQL